MIDSARRTAAFSDGPDDEALTAHRVAAGEDGRFPSEGGDTPLPINGQRRARGGVVLTAETELLKFGTNKPSGDQNQIGGNGDLLVAHAVDHDHGLDASVAVKLQRLGGESALTTFGVG